MSGGVTQSGQEVLDDVEWTVLRTLNHIPAVKRKMADAEAAFRSADEPAPH